jgi:anionic cell wall polymer biosynthesis LytR-Cps2A-Psr (LCP) family protein
MSGSSRDYRPDTSFNTTFLLMLSENKGGAPDYYMLMNYRPRDEVILLVPLRESLYAVVGDARGTLSDIYWSGGSESVVLAVKNTLGIDCEHYIKFDRSSFIEFLYLAGETPINIPYDLTGGEVEFYAGSHVMNGEELYAYLTYPDFGQGEDYRYRVHGMAISNFINRNSRNLTVTQMQTLFNRILNTTDTNLDFGVFTRNQPAYLYTTQNSFNIADYYVPNWTAEGEYSVITDSSKAAIRDRFGLRE